MLDIKSSIERENINETEEIKSIAIKNAGRSCALFTTFAKTVFKRTKDIFIMIKEGSGLLNLGS